MKTELLRKRDIYKYKKQEGKAKVPNFFGTVLEHFNINVIFQKVTWSTVKSELTDFSPLVSELRRPYPQLLGYSLPVQITMFSSYLL